MVDVDCAVGDSAVPDRRATTRATRSTRPRSSTGAAARTARRRDARQHQNHENETSERVGGTAWPTPSANPRTQRSRPRPPSDRGRRTNQDWWPNQPNLQVLHQQLAAADPAGRGLRLPRGVQAARRRGAEAGHLRGDDDLAGLVAGRLRPLRAAVHPDVVARRRHLPDRTTAAAAAARAPSASPRSTAGPTTPASTRRAGCCGRSSRSTAARSPGPT